MSTNLFDIQNGLDIFNSSGSTVFEINTTGGDGTLKLSKNSGDIFIDINSNEGSVVLGGDSTDQIGNNIFTILGNTGLEFTTNANEKGIIYKDTELFLHDFSYGDNGTITPEGGNLFLGENSGNLTMGSTASVIQESSNNTGIGKNSLHSVTTGYRNTAFGSYGMDSTTEGYYNTCMGYHSMFSNTTGNYNTAIGAETLSYLNNGYNTALGHGSGKFDNGGDNNSSSTACVFIGYDSRPSDSTDSNEIVIGYQSRGEGSNTTVLGNNNTEITYINSRLHMPEKSTPSAPSSDGGGILYVKTDGKLYYISDTVSESELLTDSSNIAYTNVAQTFTEIQQFNQPIKLSGNRINFSETDDFLTYDTINENFKIYIQNDLKFSQGENKLEIETNTEVSGILSTYESSPDVDDGGLCLNQGYGDRNILSLKNEDVSHPMTGIDESDTFFTIKKRSSSYGGAWVTGYSESNIEEALTLHGITGDTTPTSGIVQIVGSKFDGRDDRESVSDDESVISLSNNFSNRISMMGNGNLVFHTGTTIDSVTSDSGTSIVSKDVSGKGILLLTNTGNISVHSFSGGKNYQTLKLIHKGDGNIGFTHDYGSGGQPIYTPDGVSYSSTKDYGVWSFTCYSGKWYMHT
jgi:hypothetical protein